MGINLWPSIATHDQQSLLQWATKYDKVLKSMKHEGSTSTGTIRDCRRPQPLSTDCLSANESKFPDCTSQAGRLDPTVVGMLDVVILSCGCSLSPWPPLMFDLDVESLPFTKRRMKGTLAAMVRLLISAAVHIMRFVTSSVLVSIDLTTFTEDTNR